MGWGPAALHPSLEALGSYLGMGESCTGVQSSLTHCVMTQATAHNDQAKPITRTWAHDERVPKQH